MMIIVDTNVISELMRPTPSVAVAAWSRAQGSDIYTTSITAAEIFYGIERLPEGRRKEQMRTEAGKVLGAFAGKVLAFDMKAARQYAAIAAAREHLGIPIDALDGQIAAICRARRGVLATRNVKDFTHAGIDVVDPWHP